MFKNVINSFEFNSFISGIELNVKYNCFDSKNNNFWIEVYKNSDYCLGLLSSYSSFHNATIFTEDTGMIYFVIEHYTGLIYEYLGEFSHFDMHEPEKYYPWRSDKEKGACIVKKLTEENLLNMLHNRLICYANN